jgi:hypothetical protein
MKHLYTPATFMVNPIDEAKLFEFIESKVKPSLQENEQITITIGALACDNCEVSQDCIYEVANKIWTGDKAVFMFHVPIRIKVLAEGGYSHSMFPSFYYPMSFEDLKPYTLPEVSLKEFMGSRFNYNPRITKNMNVFMKMINDSFVESE